MARGWLGDGRGGVTDRLQLMRTLMGQYQELSRREKDPNALPELRLVGVTSRLVARDLQAGGSALEGAWAIANALSGEGDGEADPTAAASQTDAADRDELWLRRGYPDAWLRRRSAVWRRIDPTSSPPDDPEGGPPLWGEWATGAGGDQGVSIHLRPQTGANGLYGFHEIGERHLGDTDTLQSGEDPFLCQRVVVIDAAWARIVSEAADDLRKPPPDPKNAPVLVNHVYWGGTEDDPHAIGRRFWRFAGFANDDVTLPKENDPEKRASRKRAQPGGEVQ